MAFNLVSKPSIFARYTAGNKQKLHSERKQLFDVIHPRYAASGFYSQKNLREVKAFLNAKARIDPLLETIDPASEPPLREPFCVQFACNSGGFGYTQ